MDARQELHQMLAKTYSLEDMAQELETIGACFLIIADTVQPIPRPDGNISAETVENGLSSVYHHIMRVADTLYAIQRMANSLHQDAPEV